MSIASRSVELRPHGPDNKAKLQVPAAMPASQILSNKAAYLVLGMHRSGTSALTKVLSGSGAALPRSLIEGDASNPLGYFESWKIVALNTARLNATGSAWDDPFAFPMRLWPREKEQLWREHARASLVEDFDLASDHPLMKDPRLSILLPAWRPIIEDLALDARCVIAVRHPLAVAASLARRDSFTVQKSVLLWINYMLAAATYSEGLPRVFVSYDALLSDWRAQAARIEAGVGAPTPASSPLAAAELDRVVTADLRRSASDGNLGSLGWIGEVAAGLFEWLQAAVEDRAADPQLLREAAEALAHRRREFGAVASPVSRDLDMARAEIVRLRRQLSVQAGPQPEE